MSLTGEGHDQGIAGQSEHVPAVVGDGAHQPLPTETSAREIRGEIPGEIKITIRDADGHACGSWWAWASHPCQAGGGHRGFVHPRTAPSAEGSDVLGAICMRR